MATRTGTAVKKPTPKTPATPPDPNAIQQATNTSGTTIGKAQTDSAAQATTAQIDTTAELQFRQKQMDFANMLQAQISGTGGASPAMLQFQQSTDSAIATQMAIARSGGGPLAMHQALSNTATITQTAANQAGQLRAQETLNAQGQLADVINQGRSSDINLAENQAQLQETTNTTNAGLTEQQNIANMQAINNRNTVQGQLNTSIANTNTQANASITSASISASGAVRAAGEMAAAQNNATAATNYRFNAGMLYSMDQQNYVDNMGVASGQFGNQNTTNAANQAINHNTQGAIGNAGTAIAGASTTGSLFHNTQTNIQND